MAELEKMVAAIRFRMRMFRVMDCLLWGLLGALVALNVVLLAMKLFPVGVEFWMVAAVVLGCSLVAGLVVGAVTRITMFQAALAADAKLNLRERISSALVLSQMDGAGRPAFAALESDAREYARAIRPRKDFQYKMPRHGRYTILPAIGLAALYFMPQFDLLASKVPPPVAKPPAVVAATPEERKEASERIKKLAESTRTTMEEIEAALGLELADKLDRLSEDVALGKKSEKEAVAEMSRLSDELKVEEREISKKTQSFKQLQGLAKSDKTQELMKDLKNQDFKAAAEQMKEMAEQLQNMDAAEMKDLAEEMKQLSESVKDNPEMSKALEQAAQAMEQMAQAQQEQEKEKEQGGGEGQQQSQQSAQQEESKSGNSDQSQQKSQQANQQGSQSGEQKSQQSASQQQAAAQAAAALQQAAASAEDLSQMMQQMAAMSQAQKSMGECMSQCMGGGEGGAKPGQGKGQGQGTQPGQGESGGGSPSQQAGGSRPGNTAGQSDWKEGINESSSLGSGGPGRGEGGQVPHGGDGNFDFKDEFIPGQKNEGQIIAVIEIDAPAPRGESNVSYTRVPQEYRQKAADAITDNEIPAGMRNSVRDYFEAINFGETKK